MKTVVITSRPRFAVISVLIFIFSSGVILYPLFTHAHCFDWVEQHPENFPSPRSEYSIAYDSLHERIILFGGGINSGQPAYNDTWAYDDGTWTQISTAEAPDPRIVAGCAYDNDRDVVVLFGGSRNGYGGYFGDTWEFNGDTWVEKTTLHTPSARRHHEMAFDISNHRIILFGGWNGSTALNDTWSYDGSDWTRIQTQHAPSPRTEPLMSYDASRSRVVLYGGNGSAGGLSDTWEFDGFDWIEICDDCSPGPLYDGGMAYDTKRHVSVVFGGYTGQGKSAATWSWDGVSWSRDMPEHSPPARLHISLAFDTHNQVFVLFGGVSGSSYLDDTWTYGSAQGPSVLVNGMWMTYQGDSEEVVLKIQNCYQHKIYNVYLLSAAFVMNGETLELSPLSESCWITASNTAHILGMQLHAYISSEVDSSYIGDNSELRTEMINKLRNFVESNSGIFDGLHIDLEPVPNNSNWFIDFLSEVKSIPNHGELSVATPKWISWPFGGEWFWDSGYFDQVI